MQMAGVLDFITGAEPTFRRPDVQIRPGDKFGCYDQATDWLYLDVLTPTGPVPASCVYGRTFSAGAPEGCDGFCRRSQLDLRIDNRAWGMIREHGWREPGCALRLQALPPRPMPAAAAAPSRAPGATAALPRARLRPRGRDWVPPLLTAISRWLRLRRGPNRRSRQAGQCALDSKPISAS